jgi:hypothetical protein
MSNEIRVGDDTPPEDDGPTKDAYLGIRTQTRQLGVRVPPEQGPELLLTVGTVGAQGAIIGGPALVLQEVPTPGPYAVTAIMLLQIVASVVTLTLYLRSLRNHRR